MSQTAPQTAPQAAPPAPAPAPAPVPAPAPASKPDAVVDTPALLNRWQLIGMSVAIVFGVLSALVQFLGWQADGRAAADTEQLVRVQKIQSSLLNADALATNSFLVGGLEDPDQRAQYDDAVDEVLTLVTQAADAQPADQQVLAELNVAVNDYATAVAQARANNRLGYPIGAEYLSAASSELDERAMPILDALVEANTERAEGAMNGQHPFWLLLIGVAALAVLVWLNQQLAEAFRRRINKGLVVAGVIVLVVTAVAVFGAFLRDSSNDSLQEEEFAAAVELADTRTAANAAKATESLRLIKRGGGATFEQQWQESVDEVEDGLSRAEVVALWDTYKERHAEIVRLDDAGRWDAARTLATRTDEQGSTAPFAAFDGFLAEDTDANAAAATDELRSGRAVALVTSILTVLLGVAAAVAVARGIGERRREFS
ncbi:hypothetical protein [Nocardioides sp. J54]|uniref:hypothetical protein n=1 Tax=Nocardioides sp. J54 TaxID=935866 RepID=UPI0004B9E077|nr:hypothetical protein [Nocardioides sp. J54]